MSHMTDDEIDAIDLALVAYVEDEEWFLEELNLAAVDSIDSIANELRRFPGGDDTLAMLSIDEDFILLVRGFGLEVRVLLSDASAATDWSLARSAMTRIGVHVTDLDDEVPAGDLAILEDLGMSAGDLAELLDEPDLMTEEILGEIAEELGFGELYDDYTGPDE